MFIAYVWIVIIVVVCGYNVYEHFRLRRSYPLPEHEPLHVLSEEEISEHLRPLASIEIIAQENGNRATQDTL